MLLFLILLIPAVLAIYCICTSNKKFAPAIFTGLLSAVLYCTVRVIVFNSHRLITDSIGANYLYYLVRLTLIPVIVIYSLYILLTRDTWEFKLSMFFPLLASFYAVYIPYKVVAFTQSVYSGYDIFLKPAIYIAMLGMCAICIRFAYKLITEKNIPFGIISIVVAVVYLSIPALFDALHAVNKASGLVIAGGIIYSLIPAAYGVLSIVMKIISASKEE